MNTWAAPGVQCVCINDEFGGWKLEQYFVPTRIPMINEVLTIKDVFDGGTGVYLRFEEIPADQSDGPLRIFGIGWPIYCFRPLEKRKTDISIFLKLLTPAGRIPVDA